MRKHHSATRSFSYFVRVVTVLCMTEALSTLQAGEAPAPVTIQSLLHEMVDRDAVARIPSPHYSCRQASSWDRSQKAVQGKNWFANRDFDHSLRRENNAGRTEFVIMEDDGPGCVTRIWRPLDTGNELPRATIRFYLDGSPEPALEADCSELLSARSVIEEPYSFIASDEKESKQQIGLPKGYRQMGGNLYFPIPYAAGCKVTFEIHSEPGNSPNNVFFYIINYRSYEAGTPVQSFTMARYKAAETLRAKIGRELAGPGTGVKATEPLHKTGTLEPGSSLSIALPEGPRAIRELTVNIPPASHAEAVRDLWVSIGFDDEGETV